MANLTAPRIRKTHDSDAHNGVIGDGITVYEGAYLAARCASNSVVVADSTVAGQFVPFAETNGLQPFGFSNQPAGEQPEYDNDIEGTVGDGTKASLIQINNGQEKEYSVAGATANTAVFEPVYFLDDNLLTLTPGTKNAFVPGFLLSRRGQSSTGLTSLVYFFSANELYLQAILGGSNEFINLGYFNFASVANGDLAEGIVMKNHAKITELYCIVDVALAGGTSFTLNVEIDAVAVSSAGMAMTTNAKAAKVSATIDGSTTEYHENSVLTVTAASVSGSYSAGAVNLFMRARNLPGF